MSALSCARCGRVVAAPAGVSRTSAVCPQCGGRLKWKTGSGTVPAEQRQTPRTGSAARPGTDRAPTPRDQTPRPVTFLGPPERDGDMGTLAGFHVKRVVGEGAGGLVFEAEDPSMGRRVALKVMRPEVAGSSTARMRFLREARAGGAVQHENIVPVYQVGESSNNLPYIAMQFLRGESLEERLKRERPLGPAEVVRIGREAAEGLAAAHAAGLTHRDVKPANLWLEEGTGRVKLLDFGLAQAAAADARLTATGAFIGTPAYISPEQARHATGVDGRADLFSLGAVMYEMAAGRRAFDATGLINLLYQVANHVPPPPDKVNPAVPAALSQLIMRMLDKDPARRPATARAVADELALMEKPADPWRAFRWALAGAAAAGLLAVGGLTVGVAVWLAPRPKAAPVVEEKKGPAAAESTDLANARGYLDAGDRARAFWWKPAKAVEAERAYASAIGLAPELADAHVGRAAVLAADPYANHAAAKAAADKAAAAAPTSPLALAARAAMRAAVGEVRGAREDMSHAPPGGGADAALIRHLRGLTLARCGDPAGAEREFDAALAAVPESWAALVGRGDARRALGKAEAAIEDYSAALLVDKKNPEALLGRGLTRLALGDAAAAAADLSAALEASPNFLPALDARADALKRLGRTKEAEADRRRADEYRAHLAKDAK